MKFRNLGPSGLSVSVVGMGCNNFGGRTDLEATRKVVHKALDLGITLFDTADSYGGSEGGKRGGSEDYLGQILGERRKDIVLATKFGLPMDDAEKLKGASRRYMMSAVEAIKKAGSLDQDKLIAAMSGLKHMTPFGMVEYRAIDHQSTMGAYVGRIAVKDGKGYMKDWRFIDSNDALPSDAEILKMRPKN